MSKVDWALAATVARRVAGRSPFEGTYHTTRYAREAPGMVARASELVARETRLELPGAPEVRVISREEWIDMNVASFAALLAPLEGRMPDRPGSGGAAGRMMGAEIGAVLGLLARRVLGQYELVLPAPGEEVGDTVVFVGGNVVEMERRHEFRSAEFRLWVALHEMAHRAQFVGVPWMRDYFFDLVGELVDASAPEPGRLVRVTEELFAAMRSGRPLLDRAGVLGLLANPAQRAVLDRVQALMTLLEGHGHAVMDRIGARVLVTQRRMSRVLQARRMDARTAVLLRLVGLEMKLRQYEDGARFIAGVEEIAGWSALDAAWRGPAALPTLTEIEAPEQWLDRVA